MQETHQGAEDTPYVPPAGYERLLNDEEAESRERGEQTRLKPDSISVGPSGSSYHEHAPPPWLVLGTSQLVNTQLLVVAC